MLTIRQNQVRILGRPSFVLRAVRHLRAHFATECDCLGPERLQVLVERGLDRAREHGIESERDVCRFLNLMIVFGEDFDRVESWARAVLAEPGTAEAVASRLYAQGILHEPTPRDGAHECKKR